MCVYIIVPMCMYVNGFSIQAEYLEPHLHGVMAFFNFVLVRLDYFENSAKGKLVSQLNTPGGC